MLRQLIAVVVISILDLSSCVYRLRPRLAGSSQQRIRIVNSTPERYVVRVRTSDYHVPADGRLAVDITMVRGGCDVYLFDRIPLKRAPDPAKEKIISINAGGTTLRRLSIEDLSKLPVDSGGYRRILLRD